MKEKGEYAKAGVDYRKIEPFKQKMVEMGRRTLHFPNKRSVFVEEDAVYYYDGPILYPRFRNTQEGLGNKNWIAEWMYQFSGTSTYYESVGVDAALMAVNDSIAKGFMPIIYTDEVAAGDSEWFEDEKRSDVLVESFFKVCEMVGMALPAGESPSLKYLIKAELPVKSAPSLSGCVTGIASRSNIITGKELNEGDHIIAVTSSGLHSNGISLVIKRAMSLPEKFLTELYNGNTLGEESLIPTISYVDLVEALLENKVNVHAFLPSTGSGLSKIAFDHRQYTYHIQNWWEEIPPLFQFMLDVGVSLEDCLTTFNMGTGYYSFVPSEEVEFAIETGEDAGYELLDIGIVEKGERKVVINKNIFIPESITLPPPGE